MGLFALSIVTGIIFVVIYGKISPQDKIRNAKAQIKASLLESILYRHDIGTSLKAQFSSLIGGIKYIRFTVLPFIVLAIPGVLVLYGAYNWYAYQPLAVGKSAVVTIQAAENAELNVGNNPTLEVEVGPLRVPSKGEASWRVRATAPGTKNFAINLDNQLSKVQILGDPATYDLLGLELGWLSAFIVLSLASGVFASIIFKVSL